MSAIGIAATLIPFMLVSVFSAHTFPPLAPFPPRYYRPTFLCAYLQLIIRVISCRPPPNATAQAMASCAAAESMAPSISAGATNKLNTAFAKNASNTHTASGSKSVRIVSNRGL